MVAAGAAGVHRDEKLIVEVLGIDHSRAAGARDVSEDLEEAAHADVVAVRGDAVADPAGAFGVLLERLDADEFADLGITKNPHDE